MPRLKRSGTALTWDLEATVFGVRQVAMSNHSSELSRRTWELPIVLGIEAQTLDI